MHHQPSQHAQEDPFDLNRFVGAQAGVYERALTEVKRGQKRSHWMWFIFPQIEGLGRSSTAQFCAIKNADEAKAYLNHSLLGPRLIVSGKVGAFYAGGCRLLKSEDEQ